MIIDAISVVSRAILVMNSPGGTKWKDEGKKREET